VVVTFGNIHSILVLSSFVLPGDAALKRIGEAQGKEMQVYCDRLLERVEEDVSINQGSVVHDSLFRHVLSTLRFPMLD
jgi:hypothetical protein